MRRILSWTAIVLTAGAFIILCLIWILKINIVIPILMFAAALILLAVVKRMPPDDPDEGKTNADQSGDGDRPQGTGGRNGDGV